MTKEGAGAVVVLVDAMFVDQRRRIAQFAARRRLPSVYGLADFLDAGGLMFYGANDTERFRRAAIFVDKILRGAKPARHQPQDCEGARADDRPAAATASGSSDRIVTKVRETR